MPLVDLEKGRDDVYGWLELVFQFCEGKPFVYYSQYVPSARIYALARSHKVRLRWCPLGRLSAHARRAPSLLAPALAERQSVAGVAGAPGDGRGNDDDPQAVRVGIGRHQQLPHPRIP